MLEAYAMQVILIHTCIYRKNMNLELVTVVTDMLLTDSLL